ncbi:MAG: CvpA family protein [Bacteroidales bacterium]|nr:MAG: CvpA family protein [Bacteroidales bacterium]
MNIFDIVFLVVFIWAAYKGFSKGLIIQAASLAALLLGIFGAIKFSGYTAFVLTKKFNVTGEYLQLTAFAVTFVVIVIGVHLVARLTEKFVKAVALDFVNRILGLLFSTIKIAFIVSIILVIINTINYKTPFLPKDSVNKSLLYKPLSSLAPMLFPFFRLEYDKIRRDMQSNDKIVV